MDQFLKRHVRLFDESKLVNLHAVDIFEEVVALLRVFLEFCGSNVLSMGKFRWNFNTWMCICSLASFECSLIYTVFFRSYGLYEIMDTLSYSGMSIQGIVKMHGALSRVNSYQQTYFGLCQLYERFSKDPDDNVALNKCVLLILYIFRFFLLSYLAGGLAFFVVPLYMIVFRQENMLILRLELPFVDPNGQSGFALTLAYQVLMIFVAIFGLLAADMGIMILILQIFGIVDVFINNLKRLDRMLEDPEIDEEAIHRKVSEICVMHQEIIRYEEDLNGFYYTTVFVQVVTSVISLSLCLFVIYMTQDWTRVMFLVALFFQLLEFCLLGTVLTLKNEHLRMAVYDTKWYLLSQSDQKKLQFVLHRSQHAVEMAIGGIGLLNMETYVAIIKTIYSYFTMLVTFME